MVLCYNTFIFGVIVDAEIMVKLHGSEIAFSGGNCCAYLQHRHGSQRGSTNGKLVTAANVTLTNARL